MTQQNTTATVEAPAMPQEVAYLPTPLVLDFSAVEISGEQFARFCADNDGLRFEYTARKELVVMPPMFSRAGWREGQLYFWVESWSRVSETGITFGPSAGFIMQDGGILSPDVSWILRERWEQWEERLRDEGKNDAFAELIPDFVIELRSESDSLTKLQNKMQEYIENGVRLGWLIDPRQRRVYIYRPGQPVEVLQDPATVSGEDVLTGFVLNLQDIW